jgi:hypothetical protein
MIGKEKYFRVLGIKPTKDTRIIKKAYRKLALKHHPDKNPSPDAHYQFIIITEAYEILTGQRTEKSRPRTTVKPKSKEEIFAEKVKFAKERWKKQQEEEANKDKIYFEKIASGWKWKIFQVFAGYTAIFSSLLVFDYFVDGAHESIDPSEISQDFFGRDISARGEYFSVDAEEYWFGPHGYPPVRGNYSYLFHDLRSISIITSPITPVNHKSFSSKMRKFDNFENKKLYTTVSYRSVHGSFPFLHFMFLVPMLVVIFKRPALRFTIWRLVSLWILYPTIIIISLSNDRIFNLIDLFK